ISRGAILSWIKQYKNSGGKLESLYPKDRQDRAKSRAIDAHTAENLIALKKSMPQATVPVLIKAMEQRRLVSVGTRLKATTVYRFFHSHKLMKPPAGYPDRRKFEAELPNDLWQSDVMHGPLVTAEPRQKKSYLIAFLDDHSRLVPYARFYLSEKLEDFLDAFENALVKRGLPRKLYVDNGAAYRSKHLEHISASLGIALVHAKPYQPQGKGKIERFNRRVRQQFLSTLPSTLSLGALNESFDAWLRQQYHGTRHSAIGQTPMQRFTCRMECIRPAPDNLSDHFRAIARRRVAKDRTVTLNGRLFEAPVALIGQRVDLAYHPDRPQKVEVLMSNKSYGYLQPLDLAVNCRVKRDENNHGQIATDGCGHKSGKIF
ncbi:MAG: DDE-type integrase/transposase/recombinase, partial [Desulfatitalea sp.]|nr:DDE-type integrase/transposase/recombinase [Desulfatitalea sp.]